MIFDSPQVLDKLLSHLAENIAMYLSYQADNGADYVQVFDSWGGQLPPYLWSRYMSKQHETASTQIFARLFTSICQCPK